MIYLWRYQAALYGGEEVFGWVFGARAEVASRWSWRFLRWRGLGPAVFRLEVWRFF